VSAPPFRVTEGPLIPAPRDPRPARYRGVVLRLVALASILAALLLALKPLLVLYALLFRVNDPARSDALVILLGGLSHRPTRAAELYKQGIAPTVIVCSSPVIAELGLDETAHTVRVLEQQGVPKSAIVVIPDTVTSTRDEASRLAAYARGRAMKRITVVTTAFHTRRSRMAFRKALRDQKIDVRMAAAAEPGFRESDWFQRDEGMVAYFAETIKLIYYWIR
jgi:uncharacterized SAM-binding protein YcdF (DUF218 family)